MTPDDLTIDAMGHATTALWDGNATQQRDIRVWQQFVDVDVSSDQQTVTIQIPAGISLSLHLLSAERMVQIQGTPDSPGATQWVAYGNPASATINGQADYSVITTSSEIEIIK